MSELSAIRKEYKLKELRKSAVQDNPLFQFKTWLEEAIAAKVNEPTAMNLATVGESGRPSARIVLLKDLKEEGLFFYTNYLSRKGIDIENNPFAAITFFWPELERQVRVEGKIRKTTPEISDNYFLSRPENSKIGAIASPQSKVIESREELENTEKAVLRELNGRAPKRPLHWGGYCLYPEYYEFWQGRPSRLHDRIAYTFSENQWHIARLAP